MLLSAVPKRLLMRRSRSLSPCRALHTEPGELNARELETDVENSPAVSGSRKWRLLREREDAWSSSSSNFHAQYRQLASRWRTSLESRRSSWAALVTAGHPGTDREESGGQKTGAGGRRGAASAGVLSPAALAFCFNRDNKKSGKYTNTLFIIIIIIIS